MKFVIGSLTCASPPLIWFQCFDFAREFDRSIMQAVVLIVYSQLPLRVFFRADGKFPLRACAVFMAAFHSRKIFVRSGVQPSGTF